MARWGDQGVLLFGGYAHGGYSNALYLLDASRGIWSQPLVRCEQDSCPPLARLGATASAMHPRQGVLLFGGSAERRPTDALDVLTASGYAF